jgi:ATP-dependent Clp protease ATP-binding subunit ClpC
VFERFSDGARRSFVFAQDEARLLGHSFIGTEHLLLGLLHDTDGAAGMALQELGVSLHVVRVEVAETIGPSAGSARTDSPPFTPRAKRVLERSLREALDLESREIGTEHVLLGLLWDGEGVAVQVLQMILGIGVDGIRGRVGLVLHHNPFGPSQAPQLSYEHR